MNTKPTSRKICVIGSANVDLTFRTPRMPDPGETISGHSLHQGLGGKGANQAVAAARLGGDVTFIACVGSDAFGSESVAAYENEGINTAFIRRVENQPTGTAAIVVDDNAENCIVVVAGANALLSPADVRSASSAIESADAVLCQLETPIDAAIEAFRIARAANVMTILTPAPAKNVTDELLALCDVCVPNKTEVAAITGLPTGSEKELLAAAESLRGRGVKRVAITVGVDGVLVLDDSGFSNISAIAVEPIDTTGAGDAFTGALAISLADGLPIAEAAQRAATVAAISVTKIGTQSSFPTLEEINHWITQG